MTGSAPISADLLRLDAPAEAERIAAAVREQVFQRLRRRGAVVGLSGGVDSSVVAGLLARALGRDRVLGLLMPEQESAGESERLGRLVAETFGIPYVVENIGPILEAAGCYARRDAAIRRVIPHYTSAYRCKLVMPGLLEGERLSAFWVVVRSPSGEETRARLTADAYLEIVAATSFKQRTRKMLEYFHADRLRYAVAGTPNRLEYDQGFFVKNGDGSADLKPIAHLYKTQVYQLAAYLGVPEEIRSRPPTTDTYSLPQTQEEFYFSVPYDVLDLCLYGKDHGIPPERLAPAVRLTAEQVDRVYRDIDAKRRAARYLHEPPLLVPES